MQPENKIVIQASVFKRFLYGTLTILGILAIITSIVLIVTGPAEDIFRRVAWLVFGLAATLQVSVFFIHTSIRLVFEGSTLHMSTFRAKASVFDFSVLQRIVAVRVSPRALGKRPTDLLFTDINGNTFSLNAYSIGALSKDGRQQLLHILEPYILKEGAVQENDKAEVQRLLSDFTPDTPIRLTADAEAFAKKAKRRSVIAKTIMIIGFLPLTLLILMIMASAISTSITCDKLLAEGKETSAQITTLDVKTNKSNEISTLRLDLSYTVNGNTHKKEFYIYSADAKTMYDKIKNASSIQIRYLPNDPKTIELASEFSDGTATACKF